MKKLLLLLMVAGAYSTSFAQFDAGQVIVGGELGFSTGKEKLKGSGSSTESDATLKFNFSPRFGYFLSEGLEAGARLGFVTEATGSGDTKFGKNTLSFGPYVRKYFTLDENLFVYGQGSMGFGSTKVKAGSSSEKTNSNFSIGVTPGAMFRLGDKVALEFSVGFFGYRSSTEFNADTYTDPVTGETVQLDAKNSNFGLDIDLGSLNFGVSIFL